jgi:hypothetical protein
MENGNVLTAALLSGGEQSFRGHDESGRRPAGISAAGGGCPLPNLSEVTACQTSLSPCCLEELTGTSLEHL